MTAISSDPVVMEFFPSLQDYDHTKKMIEYIMQHQEQHGYGIYAVELKDTKEFIGFVGLDRTRLTIPSIQFENVEVVEIGWRLQLIIGIKVMPPKLPPQFWIMLSTF